MTGLWKDPLAAFDPEKPAPPDVVTNDYLAPSTVWDETKSFKAKMYPVGRLRYYRKWPGHGGDLWTRWRWWPTRRRVLDISSAYNPRTLKVQKTIDDKRPIWWVLGFIALALAPLFIPETRQNAMLPAGAIFGLYASINLIWMLIIGTAGIFSLASYAVVGAGAYASTYFAMQLGLPWFVMPLIGGAVGLVFGVAIALPATRLEGFYYSLLTLGVVELCRVYVLQSRQLGNATGGLYGGPSYIPEHWDEYSQLLLGYYACNFMIVLALILYRFVNGKQLGRVLRMAPEKREAFAEATGVNYRAARIKVFLISSAALGFIGGFYATHFKGASPNLFTFDTMLLGLAMLVVGGIGRAEGAVVGTLIVVFIDRVLLDLGPLRLILIGLIMMAVVLWLRNGIFGIKAQFRGWRDKKKSEARSTRAEKGGEMLPEEAAETRNKDLVYFRRFDKMQRDFLKKLITPEIIEEHRNKPLGQHSEALERVMTYFRRAPQTEKYAITVIKPFEAYRIVALSGTRGVAPRLVEDRIYKTPNEAYHALFMRRVQDLLES